eukprot:433635-Amorphochlora_amoeboformis.AAC.1
MRARARARVRVRARAKEQGSEGRKKRKKKKKKTPDESRGHSCRRRRCCPTDQGRRVWRASWIKGRRLSEGCRGESEIFYQIDEFGLNSSAERVEQWSGMIGKL